MGFKKNDYFLFGKAVQLSLKKLVVEKEKKIKKEKKKIKNLKKKIKKKKIKKLQELRGDHWEIW